MEFYIVLRTVATMLIYMIVGFSLIRLKLGDIDHAKTMSSLLIYICGPCMVINAFINMDFTVSNAMSLLEFFLASFIVQALFFGVLYLIFRKKLEEARYRILILGATLGNVGFLGLPLVTSIFPEEPIVAGYSSIYVMSMNLIVFTMGVFMLTRDKKYISMGAMIKNPTTIAILIALPFYILDLNMPQIMTEGIWLLGKMTTPICMIVLGMRLAASDLKIVFVRPFVYASSMLKLVVFPLLAYGCVSLIPVFDNTFRVSILVLSATPTAAIVLSMAEIHGCEQELSANAVLLATVFCIITLPLMVLVAG